jgi:hypothetical protein
MAEEWVGNVGKQDKKRGRGNSVKAKQDTGHIYVGKEAGV